MFRRAYRKGGTTVHAVISWMLGRGVIETAIEAGILRAAFNQMSYPAFAMLNEDGVCTRLQEIDVHPEVDRAQLARKLCESVIGKTISSMIEDGQLTGSEASRLRQATTTANIDTVMAAQAPEGSPLARLQAALMDGRLVTAPLEAEAPAPMGGGSAIAIGDRSVATAYPHTGIIATGDNPTIYGSGQ